MVYLGLGTNLGDKEQNLRMSIKKIEERIGNVVSLSAFYATAPWGFAHPLMTERRFVMEPLSEIAPDVVHPVLHKTMKELFISSFSPQ